MQSPSQRGSIFRYKPKILMVDGGDKDPSELGASRCSPAVPVAVTESDPYGVLMIPEFASTSVWNSLIGSRESMVLPCSRST